MPASTSAVVYGQFPCGQRCALCDRRLEAGNVAVVCAVDQTVHHQDCWEFHGKQCANSACPSRKPGPLSSTPPPILPGIARPTLPSLTSGPATHLPPLTANPPPPTERTVLPPLPPLPPLTASVAGPARPSSHPVPPAPGLPPAVVPASTGAPLLQGGERKWLGITAAGILFAMAVGAAILGGNRQPDSVPTATPLGLGVDSRSPVTTAVSATRPPAPPQTTATPVRWTAPPSQTPASAQSLFATAVMASLLTPTSIPTVVPDPATPLATEPAATPTTTPVPPTATVVLAQPTVPPRRPTKPTAPPTKRPTSKPTPTTTKAAVPPTRTPIPVRPLPATPVLPPPTVPPPPPPTVPPTMPPTMPPPPPPTVPPAPSNTPPPVVPPTAMQVPPTNPPSHPTDTPDPRKCEAIPASSPEVSIEPRCGHIGQAVGISASGFDPGEVVVIQLRRPDGSEERSFAAKPASDQGVVCCPRIKLPEDSELGVWEIVFAGQVHKFVGYIRIIP